MKKIIILNLIMFNLFLLSGCGSGQKKLSNELQLPGTNTAQALAPSEGETKDCDKISNIKAIKISGQAVEIDFNLSDGGYQVVGKKTPAGRLQMLERGGSYTLKSGENIYWGDGDHAFTSLTVKTIAGESALLEITDSFTFPGVAEKTTTVACRVVGSYP